MDGIYLQDSSLCSVFVALRGWINSIAYNNHSHHPRNSHNKHPIVPITHFRLDVVPGWELHAHGGNVSGIYYQNAEPIVLECGIVCLHQPTLMVNSNETHVLEYIIGGGFSMEDYVSLPHELV
jgi:hypothetical protein